MHDHDVKIRWKNFRSFKDTGWLSIKPITIFIGPNNAGKTSVLAPFLLLNQTLASQDPDCALITRGNLIDVGNYKDYIHKHELDLPLSFGLCYRIPNTKEASKKRSKKDSKKDSPFDLGGISVQFQHNNVKDIQLNRFNILNISERIHIARTRTKTNRFSLSGEIRPSEMHKQERMALLKDVPTNFFFTAPTVIRELPSNMFGNRGFVDAPMISNSFSRYIFTVSWLYSSLKIFFDPLSYLGPLRAWPQRYYEAMSEHRNAVGLKGEYTAAVLKGNPQIFDSLNNWVKTFGFGNTIEVNSLTKDIDNLFNISFVDEQGEKTNIADAGFGVSQLLPLLVQALTIEGESIFIAEQPEIHLNPKLQVSLADLFVYVAKQGKRVVLETHSEHLLLRLRRLIAEDKISSNQVALYFVEKEGMVSKIREVPIHNNGYIPNDQWPKDFFQEALNESLGLASAQIGQ